MFISDKSKVYGAYFGILFFVLVLISMYDKYVKKSKILRAENNILGLENMILEHSLDKALEEKSKFSDKKEGNERTE